MSAEKLTRWNKCCIPRNGQTDLPASMVRQQKSSFQSEYFTSNSDLSSSVISGVCGKINPCGSNINTLPNEACV